MPVLAPGDRVRHAAHATGTVLARLAGGRLRVRFDAARELPRAVPETELDAVVEGRPPGSGPATTASSVEPDAGADAPLGGPGPENPIARADLRQTLEALRLGVVPARHVRDYTVLRDRELADVEGLLDAGSGLRVLWGDYGAGKTHMLDVIEQLAHERDFVTARVVIDPNEIPPTHPKRLYRAVVSSLTLPDGGGRGLEAFLDALIDSEDHAAPDSDRVSRFFSPYLHAMQSGDEETIDWVRDYILGYNIDAYEVNRRLRRTGWRGKPVLALSDYRTHGRMYAHMVGTLASWSRDAGFRGLLLLFDEVEFVDQLGRSQLLYALEVLKHYAAVTLDDADLTFDPEQLYKGGQDVHRRIPLRFRADQPLAAVFALTPLDEIRIVFRELLDSTWDVALRPITPDVVPRLVARIARLYHDAYPEFAATTSRVEELVRRIDEAIVDGNDSPRAVVRGTVFTLDSMRLATEPG